MPFEAAATRRTECSRATLSLEDPLSPSPPLNGFRHLLVPLNFSPRSLACLPYATVLSRQFGWTTTLLHAVHLNMVGEERGIPLTRLADELRVNAQRRLEEILICLRLDPGRSVVRIGEPLSVILQEVAESRIDLILIGRDRRRGLGRLLGPSLGKRIIERAPCPVLIA